MQNDIDAIVEEDNVNSVINDHNIMQNEIDAIVEEDNVNNLNNDDINVDDLHVIDNSFLLSEEEKNALIDIVNIKERLHDDLILAATGIKPVISLLNQPSIRLIMKNLIDDI